MAPKPDQDAADKAASGKWNNEPSGLAHHVELNFSPLPNYHRPPIPRHPHFHLKSPLSLCLSITKAATWLSFEVTGGYLDSLSMVTAMTLWTFVLD